jgi:hypothetical protein
MNTPEIINAVSEVIKAKQDADGWADLALLGAPLNQRGVNYKAMGFFKLREFLEDFPDDIELKRDDSHQPPVMYARLINSENTATAPRPQTTRPRRNNRRRGSVDRLMDWAWMGDFRAAIASLKQMALRERWYYKTQDPAFPFPILSKYLTYTFFRLAKEGGKVMQSDRYAAFNTGLVNQLYEPIYALFEKNRVPGRQEWYFHEFCVSGVDRSGKTLASHFNPLPPRAHYFEDAAELIYDITGPEPQLNWNHIILDNVARLPLEFLEENKPSNFLFRDTTTMNTVQKRQYFLDLAQAIEDESKVFRSIKNRFSDSLALALKRVQWNYKTAIPMYYPTQNRMSLLLPLSLIDDDQIDLALVVEKTQSGNYLGHTVLPLDWAYSNARLVTRPDSDWLIAEKIDTSISEEDSDSSDD